MWRCAILLVGSAGGTGNETARVHLGSRWCGGGIDPLYAAPERATDPARYRHSRPLDSEEYAFLIAAFRKSLTEAGYVEGQNVTIEYRWADNQADRLEAMASELLKQQVSVISQAVGRSPRWPQGLQPRRSRSSLRAAPTRSPRDSFPASADRAAMSRA
jgi:hypothetical protein